MVWYIKEESWRRNEKRLTATIIVFNTVGITLLSGLEFTIAEYLEKGNDSSSDVSSGLIVAVTMFLGYMLARMYVVHRTLVS